MLAQACIDEGNWDRYTSEVTQLQGMQMPSNPSERAIIAQVESNHDLDAAKRIIDEVVKTNASALALAISGSIHGKLYAYRGDTTALARGRAETAAARILLPDNAYLLMMEFYQCFMPLQDGLESSQVRQQAETIVGRLKHIREFPLGQHACAVYYDFIGDEQQADGLWKNSGAQGWICVYHAASRYRNGHYAEAGSILQASSRDTFNAVYYGHYLALEGHNREATEIYDRLSSSFEGFWHSEAAIFALPESILLLMGEKDRAKRDIGRRLQMGHFGTQWERQILQSLFDFLCDPAARDRLFDHAETRSQRAWLYKLLGLLEIADGDCDAARESFTKCQRESPISPDAYWAAALASRLEHDAPWRQGLEDATQKNEDRLSR
jgi:hypothetical protein